MAVKRCLLPSLSVPALPLLPLYSNRVLCDLAVCSLGWERGCPWKKGVPKIQMLALNFTLLPASVLKCPAQVALEPEGV